jgi:hypothetical protein
MVSGCLPRTGDINACKINDFGKRVPALQIFHGRPSARPGPPRDGETGARADYFFATGRMALVNVKLS